MSGAETPRTGTSRTPASPVRAPQIFYTALAGSLTHPSVTLDTIDIRSRAAAQRRKATAVSDLLTEELEARRLDVDMVLGPAAQIWVRKPDSESRAHGLAAGIADFVGRQMALEVFVEAVEALTAPDPDILEARRQLEKLTTLEYFPAYAPEFQPPLSQLNRLEAVTSILSLAYYRPSSSDVFVDAIKELTLTFDRLRSKSWSPVRRWAFSASAKRTKDLLATQLPVRQPDLGKLVRLANHADNAARLNEVAGEVEALADEIESTVAELSKRSWADLSGGEVVEPNAALTRPDETFGTADGALLVVRLSAALSSSASRETLSNEPGRDH